LESTCESYFALDAGDIVDGIVKFVRSIHAYGGFRCVEQTSELVGEDGWVRDVIKEVGFDFELIMKCYEFSNTASNHPSDVAVLKLDTERPLVTCVFRICDSEVDAL
jgi:hypothetical protein